ncbi:MAG: rhodanese-like domain-containing protein [Clostridia bacterium]
MQVVVKRIISAILAAITAFAFAGCSLNIENNSLNESLNESLEKIVKYIKITAKEAKKIIDEESDYVILDVRTKSEYDDGHIKNAVLIPDNEIAAKAENVLTDKSKKILVYCRSGRRSAAAAKKLISMGYTNIIDFGGIIDWEYETVK